ncbi:AraC family transcriptional regulator [Enterococcus sp. AZ194]|uniref:AraC family transcriptional regulator n=1 Tax=Enterococcus sp. AZ194 TaxID=2774629 RepID=UPI003F687974
MSYLLVFLVPFSLISIIWYKTSVDSLNDQIQLSSRNYLLQVRSIISNNMNQLDMLTKEIGTNPKTTEKMAKHPYYSIEMMKELQRYKITSNIIDELYIYYYDEPNRFYSSAGSLDFDVFGKQRYQSYNFDNNKLKEVLDTKAPRIETIPSSRHQTLGLLTYSVPLTSSEGSIYGLVMYTMKMSDIEGILDKTVDKDTGRVFMVGENNQLLASSSGEKLPAYFKNSAEVKRAIHSSTIKTSEGTIRVNQLKDTDFGIRYVSFTNTSQVFKELNQTNSIVLLIVFVVLIAGIGAILTIGRRQYKPIRKIEKMLKNQTDDFTETNGLSDFDEFEYHVSNFLKQNEQLHQEVLRQTPYAREQVIRRLLMGRFNQLEEIKLLLQSVNIHLYDEGYFVMLVETKMVNSKTSIQNQEFLMSFLDDLSGSDYQAYGSEMLSEQAIALLVSFDTSVTQRTIVEKILTKIVSANSLVPAIGIGSVVKELKNINRTYIEGLAALEYSTVFEKRTNVHYYEKISKKQEVDGFEYPKDEKLKLNQSLLQGDFEIASETVERMITTALQKQLGPVELKLYTYDLLNSVVGVGLEIIGPEFVTQVSADFRNLNELKDELILMSRKICGVVQKKPKSQETQLHKDIFEYLGKEYHSHDISLEQVASEFDVSLSFISRFIKKESGLTFSKYIQELRLEHIKKELIETNTPIKEIIVNVGYYDVSNYTRKFKSIVGMTPGQFREKNR